MNTIPQSKLCNKCYKVKAINRFSLRGNSSTCKSCRSAISRRRTEYRNKHVLLLKEISIIRKPISAILSKEEARRVVYRHLLNHPCVDCGESDPVILEFDHVRGIKLFGVTRLAEQNVVRGLLEEEIDKCEIRCCNCHRRRTSITRNWWRVDYTL